MHPFLFYTIRNVVVDNRVKSESSTMTRALVILIVQQRGVLHFVQEIAKN